MNDSANLRRSLPAVLDKHLTSRDRDAFGHSDFAEALKCLVEDPALEPPFSIGLLGTWGTGKSTIKEIYLGELRQDARKIDGIPRNERYRAITFNAWRYGGEDIKRALLRHAYIELGGDDEELRSNLYKQVSDTVQIRRNVKDWFHETFFQNAGSFSVLLATTAAIALPTGIAISTFEISQSKTGVSVVVVAALTALAFIFRFMMDAKIKAPSFFNPRTTITFPTSSAEEYERMLIQQLAIFKHSKGGANCDRLIIFVDDLDRLSATEMVSGLDAVRTFLELPLNLQSNKLGIIFVLSCDEDRVAEALAKGRTKQGSSELPGSVFTRSDARRYLDRLFQFRLEIPKVPKLDMRTFAHMQLSGMGCLMSDLGARNVDINALLERLIHVGVQSPRNSIQIINAFAQSWWIAVRREHSGIGSSKSGALHDGAVTSHPLSLAALSAMKVDFPDFYNALQRRSELIKDFNFVIFNGGSWSDLLPISKDLLSEFVVVPEEGKPVEIKPNHRELRQYLASLQSLVLPKRLLPLMLLAEDPITRRHGDQAGEIQAAFVSGDTKGLLEGLGRHLDDKALPEGDVKLIEELFEEVAQESEGRRTNAARVVSELLPRININAHRNLMTTMSRQLSSIKPVRCNVGPRAAGKIIEVVSQEDKRMVANSFAEDFFVGNIDWLTSSGEQPNFEKLKEIALEVVDLILQVRDEVELDSACDAKVLSWIVDRTVKTAKNSTTLPFSYLDSWVANHSPDLLLSLGANYSSQAIDEMRIPEPAAVSKETLNRVETVFGSLKDEGVESNEVYWDQLANLVGVQNSDAVQLAFKEAISSQTVVSTAAANEFLKKFANRLDRGMTADTGWALDRQTAGNAFLSLLSFWRSKLDSETCDAFEALMVAWGILDETGELAKSALTTLHDNTGLVINVINKYFDADLKSCPKRVSDIVIEHAGVFDEKITIRLSEQLNTLLGSGENDAASTEKYLHLVSGLPPEIWSVQAMDAHRESLFSGIRNHFQNKRNYLGRFFPAIPALLKKVPEEKLASFLHESFSQTITQPSAHILIHKIMMGSWPLEVPPLGGYNAASIFQQCESFIRSSPMLDGVDAVFSSLIEMKEKNIVSGDHSIMADLAVILWPNSPLPLLHNIAILKSGMNSNQIVNLLVSPISSSFETGEFLSGLSYLAEEVPDEELLETSRSILSRQAEDKFGMVDGSLSAWFESLGDKKSEHLIAILRDDQLNEEQRLRVYSYCNRNLGGFNSDFYCALIPLVFSNPEFNNLNQAVSDSLPSITQTFKSPSEKGDFSRVLIGLLKSLNSNTLGLVGRAIRELGGRGILDQQGEALQGLSEDQLGILLREIPDSKLVQQEINRLKGKDA